MLAFSSTSSHLLVTRQQLQNLSDAEQKKNNWTFNEEMEQADAALFRQASVIMDYK